MKGKHKIKHMFCAVGFLLCLMVNNGTWASGTASDAEADEIENRIRSADRYGESVYGESAYRGFYVIREEILNCYHRNMPSFSGMKNDMAKQRDAIRKNVGLKYCALEAEKASYFVNAVMIQQASEDSRTGITNWFSDKTAYQSTDIYERLIFGSTDASRDFMGDIFTGKFEMTP